MLEPVPELVKILSYARQPAGEFRLQFRFIPGMIYRVWFSPNLQSWTEATGAAASFTFPAVDRAEWIDNGATTGGLGGTRFYRVSAE